MMSNRQPRDVYRGATQLQSRARRVVRPLSRALWKFELNGFDQIPTDGPAILCANHVSFLDSAFIMVHAPRNISFVGKSEYMDSWKTKFLFPALGMIPVDREGGEKANTALVAAEGVLRNISRRDSKSRWHVVQRSYGRRTTCSQIDVPNISGWCGWHPRDSTPGCKTPENRWASVDHSWKGNFSRALCIPN